MNLTHPVVLFSLAAAMLALFAKSLVDGLRTSSPAPAREPRTLPEQRQPLLSALEIEGTRTIGEHQTVTTIRIPDAQMRHNRHFDRYCFIYEHHAYRSVHMVCDKSMSVSGGSTAATASVSDF